MDKFFKLKERGTDVLTEVTAGITVFMTMAYILAVNPSILSGTGMDFGRVFAATAIASAIACFAMGLLANLPFGLSSGMGINALFAYTVCISMGYSWRWALSAVFLEGVLFIILTVTNVRETIIKSIPQTLKNAISAGVGLYIAYIGLKNAGIVVSSDSILTALNPEWYSGTSGLAILGLIIIGVLLAQKVRGAILIGMIIITLIGIPLGITSYAGGSFVPPAPYFCEFAFGEIFADGRSVADFATIVFTFLYMDMFDTVGTLIACAAKAGLLQEDGSLASAKQALLADAIGTTSGAILGTSTVTTFIESSTAVVAGGRTGLTSITLGIMFLFSLFLEPLFGSVPTAATAPALIVVGVFMMSPIKEIDFEEYTEAIPAFLTIIFMICASSIADGMMFGILSYVLINTLAGKAQKVKLTSWIVAVMLVVKIVITIGIN